MRARSAAPLLLLVAIVDVACVLRPALEGRACDEQHACVEGFHCSDGVCIAGAEPRAPLGQHDGGAPDAASGTDDGGVDQELDGGVPLPLVCVEEPPADESWLESFAATPPEGKPGERVTLSWYAPAMEECALITPFVPPVYLPASALTYFDVHPTRSSTFLLRCRADGVTHEASLVVPVGPAVLDVALAGHRTCVVVEGGVVRCWGDLNGNFALGGTDAPKVTVGTVVSETGDGLYRPSLAGSDGREPRANRIHLGRYHACAQLDDGALKCWGYNASGQLGLESTVDYWPSLGWDALAEVQLGSREVRGIALGGHHTCVAFGAGDVGCFGAEGFGRLGAPYEGGLGGAPGTMGSELPTLVLDDQARVTAIAAGWAYTCVLLDDDTVKCWGSNTVGQLGLGDPYTRGDAVGEVGPSLLAVDVGGAVIEVDASGSTTCALLDDHAVKCWGENNFGALGQGSTDPVGDGPGELGAALPPVALGDGVSAAQLAVGEGFVCVVTPAGEVKCWGNNGSGQLGLGDIESRGDEPGEMAEALPFVEVGGVVRRLEVGTRHACALLAGGRLKCWGDNSYGQLGLGDDDHRGDTPGEMGEQLPAVDVGSLVEEMFTLEGAMAALARQGCTDCHTASLPPATRASPPLDGCAPELLASDEYPLAGLDPSSAEGAEACFHWHVAEECVEGAAGLSRRVAPSWPEHSLLLAAPGSEGHPSTGRFSDDLPGSDHAYLFHWIARGAPR